MESIMKIGFVLVLFVLYFHCKIWFHSCRFIDGEHLSLFTTFLGAIFHDKVWYHCQTSGSMLLCCYLCPDNSLRCCCFGVIIWLDQVSIDYLAWLHSVPLRFACFGDKNSNKPEWLLIFEDVTLYDLLVGTCSNFWRYRFRCFLW